jgi:hypothetical protein
MTDVVGLVRLSETQSLNELQLPPLQFSVSLPVVGLRSFYPAVFPCMDTEFYDRYGYCPNFITSSNGEPFNPLGVYIFMVGNYCKLLGTLN